MVFFYFQSKDNLPFYLSNDNLIFCLSNDWLLFYQMTVSFSIHQTTVSFSSYQMMVSHSSFFVKWWSFFLLFFFFTSLSNDVFPFQLHFFFLHHIQLPMLPTVTCFKKCLSHVHQTVSMHTVSSKCTKTISSSSLTWYLSAHSMYLVRSISPVLKAVTSCTAEASCLASVTRISFSTSVSHSLILGWAAIDTGVANITCQNTTFGNVSRTAQSINFKFKSAGAWPFDTVILLLNNTGYNHAKFEEAHFNTVIHKKDIKFML